MFPVTLNPEFCGGQADIGLAVWLKAALSSHIGDGGRLSPGQGPCGVSVQGGSRRAGGGLNVGLMIGMWLDQLCLSDLEIRILA